jgi:rhodanese-related sulfurtransferase
VDVVAAGAAGWSAAQAMEPKPTTAVRKRDAIAARMMSAFREEQNLRILSTGSGDERSCAPSLAYRDRDDGARGDLPKHQEIVAYCCGPYCVLAFEAVALLREHGFKVRRLEDGFP